MKFILPEQILAQHLVVLGKTGKGKSSVLRYIVEYLLREKKRVCIIDPKGDWWGLKHSADGKGPGFPVILFGDFKGGRKGDVPINDASGAQVAELIASGNRPCVIGFNGWTHGAMLRFWIAFAQTLFGKNNGELYLVGDEFHNFAPKGKIMDVDAGKCLHWSNKILSEGRGLGLICMIASQRPQKVHNDSLTCCETLVAMGVVHAADRQATKDWIDGCGNKEQGAVVVDALAGLQRGEAYVWSPEIGFGPERMTFPKYETFDSFAPPQLQKKVSQADWSNVDLEDVKAKLAKVIEQEKANDPAELKRQIAELNKQLRAKNIPVTVHAPAKAKEVVKEVAVIKEADLKRLEKTAEKANRFSELLATILLAISKPKGSPMPVPRPAALPQHTMTAFRARTEQPAAVPKPPTANLNQNDAASQSGQIDGRQQKILDVVAMLNVRGLTPNRDMVARWLNLHPNGGSYGTNLGWLRASGYLNGFDLTEKGQAQSRPMETGLARAREVLEPRIQKMLDALQDGAEFYRDSLAAHLGLHPKGGSYGTNLGRLRTMGLIPEHGIIKLTEAAFA